MDQTQRGSWLFIDGLIRATGRSASALAKDGGLSHTSITRFMKGNVSYSPTDRTLLKIRIAAAKYIPPEQIEQLWLIAQRQAATGRGGPVVADAPQPAKAKRTG